MTHWHTFLALTALHGNCLQLRLQYVALLLFKAFGLYQVLSCIKRQQHAPPPPQTHTHAYTQRFYVQTPTERHTLLPGVPPLSLFQLRFALRLKPLMLSSVAHKPLIGQLSVGKLGVSQTHAVRRQEMYCKRSIAFVCNQFSLSNLFIETE